MSGHREMVHPNRRSHQEVLRRSTRQPACLVYPPKVQELGCRRAKKDSIAALSPQAPTRPIEPTRPLFFSVRTNAVERNWLPRSECTTVPTASRRAIAFLSAATARDSFILESME